MHPSGVKFRLSKGLLQLKGDEVLLSDAMLEAMSVEAQLRLHLRKPPIDANFLSYDRQRRRKPIGKPDGTDSANNPFFAGLRYAKTDPDNAALTALLCF